jgi:heptosyltransferase-3
MRNRQYIDKGRSERYPMMFMDFLIDNYRKIFQRKSYGEPNLVNPKILFLANGHLGDALQISYLFPLIKKHFPKSTIHVVAGEWCDAVWKHNSFVDKVIHLNDYRTNRKKTSDFQIFQEFLTTTKSTIRELRNEIYDFSIDVRYSNDHLLFVLPFIKVKKSIGYGTRGLGGLLDIELEIPPLPRHNMDWLLGLLKPFGIEASIENIEPYFEIPEEYTVSVHQKLEKLAIDKDYFVILPESGAKEKMFDIDFWIKLIAQLQQKSPNSFILISGLTDYCDEISVKVNHPKVMSLKKLLSIHEVAVLSKNARGVFCLDSFPCHLCTIFCKVVSYFQIDHLLFLPINHYPIYIYHYQNPNDWKKINRKGFYNEQILAFDEQLIQKTVSLLTD